ncbi:MAG: hypothetical protein IH853_00230 [Bacteroidetes bacterium]|nr:hypothetical protein [Bacteroidota bacterium]MCH8245020.1 hypothetical protein [Bacteroidota bacterium]
MSALKSLGMEVAAVSMRVVTSSSEGSITMTTYDAAPLSPDYELSNWVLPRTGSHAIPMGRTDSPPSDRSILKRVKRNDPIRMINTAAIE